jgi:hypothetical protein
MKRSVQLLVVFAFTTTAIHVRAGEPTKDQSIAASEEGQDLRRAGKVSAATARFATCSHESCPVPVRADCESRLQESERAQPTIRFVVEDARGNAAPDVVIRVDGSPLGSNQAGVAMPVDIGKHQFTFESRAAGRASTSLDLVAGVKGKEVVITLKPEPPPTAPDDTDRVLGFPRKPVLVGSLATAGVAVVAGSVLGLIAGSSYSDAKKRCAAGTSGCEPGSAADAAMAGTLADVSTGAFIVGAVALALAAWTFLTTPNRSSRDAHVVAGSW